MSAIHASPQPVKIAYLFSSTPRCSAITASLLILLAHVECLLVEHQNIEGLGGFGVIDGAEPYTCVVPDVFDCHLGVVAAGNVRK